MSAPMAAVQSSDAVRARQREELGGFSWASAFFGWLVAVGMAALLTALLSAAGAAVGLTNTSEQDASGAADTISIVGGVLLVTVLLAVAGVLLGAEYNVLSQLNLPRIPIDEGTLTTGGLIALAAVVAGTLLAAIAGGKAGTHYHRKIDPIGF